MHRLILLVLATLSACGPRPEPVPTSFRDIEAPIYSSAVLEVGRLDGQWAQVATFVSDGLLCGPGKVDIASGHLRWTLCLSTLQGGQSLMAAGKPGRFAVAGMQDWWLLWVDADYRTMVVGTPSGEFGFVLNREGSLPDDRAKAVRDIFQFNGYDLTTLRFY